jgi:MinD-like ATPase involved in chromosome partitioning or flagellar assembly
VAAVDACPDQCGPLADRAGVPGRGVGLRELVAADPPVAALAEARRFLATVRPDGLEVLPGLRDLTGPGLTPAEVGWAVDLLERLFPAVVVDGPPGWTQPVPAVLLARADTVVVTARAPRPGEPPVAGCAQDALTALAAARPDLPAGGVVVLVETSPPARGRLRAGAGPGGGVATDLVEPVHGVLTIPFDPALAGDAPVHWDRLRARTREAFELLAAVVDDAPLGLGLPAPADRPGLPRSVDTSEDPTVPRSHHLRARGTGPAVAPGPG